MPHLQNLSLGLKKKLPVILQTEISECGLACLAAVAGFHGFHTDLRALRSKYCPRPLQNSQIPNVLVGILGILGNFAKVSFYNCKYF
ncbi:ATP-binding protein [Neisseria meningitidis]|nr:cysteine peptidase family C39 domain-containing protein [Neisseria meningitidis]MBG9140111.1 ATP-binding protein [Neisseria meningitidis]